MTATYPTGYRTFTPNQDLVDVVYADDMNEVQEELSATQHVLGLEPHVSTAYPSAASVADRLVLSEDDIATLLSYFTSGQLNTGAATTITGAITSNYTAAIAAEATARANKDTDLQNQINDLSGSTTGTGDSLQTQIDNEVTNRTNADTAEAAARASADTSLTGQINAVAARTTAIENALRKDEGEATRNSTRSVTSGSYQDLLLNVVNFYTNDYHPEIGPAYDVSVGRLYTGNPDVPSVWAIAASVTFLAGSTAGLRGLRLVTSGGSVLAEHIKSAASDTGDQTLSVAWSGRLTNTSGYYLKLQIFQSSGSTLTLRAHTATTPTMFWWTRIPSSVGATDPGGSL